MNRSIGINNDYQSNVKSNFFLSFLYLSKVNLLYFLHFIHDMSKNDEKNDSFFSYIRHTHNRGHHKQTNNQDWNVDVCVFYFKNI